MPPAPRPARLVGVDGRLPGRGITNIAQKEREMSNFQRSWALLKCSMRVIFENKILLLFLVILLLVTRL